MCGTAEGLTQNPLMGRFDPLGFAAIGETCDSKFIEPEEVLTSFVQLIKNPAKIRRGFCIWRTREDSNLRPLGS
jgi:hypothetical protein